MFSYPEAAKHLKAFLHLFEPSAVYRGASLDTRTLGEGDLFIALEGARRDGHDFLKEAFLKGASGALIQQSKWEGIQVENAGSGVRFRNLILVQDPSEALSRLAHWYRSRFSPETVGITGSVGKTSTKEFLGYLLGLASQGDLLANPGNLNNHLGLPLTLLRLNDRHRFCVAEIGANHPGEIDFLAKILRPTAGILTKVAPCHLEGFGSMDAIYEAKLELFEALVRHSPAIVPAGDPDLDRRLRRFDCDWVRVGAYAEADFPVTDIRVERSWVHFAVKGNRHFAFPGEAPFFAGNAAMALAAAEMLGVSLDSVPEYWTGFRLPSGRFTVNDLANGVRVIYDGYNASPESFEKALDAFNAMPTQGRKILAFADMLELGTEGQRYHRRLGETIAGSPMDCVVAYGTESRASIEAVRKAGSRRLEAAHYGEWQALTSFLKEYLRSGDILLLKASRGMAIEKVLQELQKTPWSQGDKTGDVSLMKQALKSG